MFTTGKKYDSKPFGLPYITILCGIIFILAFVYLLMISHAMIPDIFNVMNLPQNNSYDVLSAFAKGIFINYVWAFELISLLLTIVIAGMTMFKIKSKKID